MTEETENMVLEMLRRTELDMMDIKSRTTGIEITVGQMAGQLASRSLRLDRMEEPIAGIERRLDLVDHH